MKLRIVLGACFWALVITTLHIWANVGFGALAQDVKEWLGFRRPTLRVAFLPVT